MKIAKVIFARKLGAAYATQPCVGRFGEGGQKHELHLGLSFRWDRTFRKRNQILKEFMEV